MKIDGKFLSNLRFADDIFLRTETPHELQQMLQELSDESRRMGLKMNIAKTNMMVVDNTHINDWNEENTFQLEQEKTGSRRCGMGFNPASDRIATIRLQCKPVNMTVLQVYAPTSTAEEEEMEEFYEKVQHVVDEIPRGGVLYVIGD